MPRCIVCNACSEIDGGDPRAFRWNPKLFGYECRLCRSWHILGKKSSSFSDYNEDIKKRNGEVPILDNDNLETFELLSVPRVVKHSEDLET